MTNILPIPLITERHNHQQPTHPDNTETLEGSDTNEGISQAGASESTALLPPLSHRNTRYSDPDVHFNPDSDTDIEARQQGLSRGGERSLFYSQDISGNSHSRTFLQRSRSLLSIDRHLQQEAEERLLDLNHDIDIILDHIVDYQQESNSIQRPARRSWIIGEENGSSRVYEPNIIEVFHTGQDNSRTAALVDPDEEQAQLTASSVWFTGAAAGSGGILPPNMRMQHIFNNIISSRTSSNAAGNTSSSAAPSSPPPPLVEEREVASTTTLLSRSLLSSTSRPVRRRNASQRGAIASPRIPLNRHYSTGMIQEWNPTPVSPSSSLLPPTTQNMVHRSAENESSVSSSFSSRRDPSSVEDSERVRQQESRASTDYSTFSEFQRLTDAAESGEPNNFSETSHPDGDQESENNEGQSGSNMQSGNNFEDNTTEGTLNGGDTINNPDNGTNGSDDEEDWESILNTEDVTQLTTRLRCLFALLTCPIVPLAATLTLLLLWVLYSALLLDWGLPCDQPLRLYALLSAAMFAYTPHHRTVKRYLFGYWRERDGPMRPWKVRVYDQAYHAACLLWMYAGISWTTHAETCSTTSPNLYKSTRVFVLVQTIFMSILVIPLLCLPCIYLWLVRQASVIATNRRERRRKRADPAKIMASFTEVDATKEENRELLDGKECCICMCDYSEELEEAVNTGTERMSVEGAASRAFAAEPRTSNSTLGETGVTDEDDNEGNTGNENSGIVQTGCGHLFHKSCIATWISTPYSGACKCPLCREDLIPPEESGEGSTNSGNDNGAVSNTVRSSEDPVRDEENQLPQSQMEEGSSRIAIVLGDDVASQSTSSEEQQLRSIFNFNGDRTMATTA